MGQVGYEEDSLEKPEIHGYWRSFAKHLIERLSLKEVKVEVVSERRSL